jgi:hypothetical protein
MLRERAKPTSKNYLQKTNIVPKGFYFPSFVILNYIPSSLSRLRSSLHLPLRGFFHNLLRMLDRIVSEHFLGFGDIVGESMCAGNDHMAIQLRALGPKEHDPVRELRYRGHGHSHPSWNHRDILEVCLIIGSTPNDARQVPKRDWVVVGDVKRLAIDLSLRFAWVKKRVHGEQMSLRTVICTDKIPLIRVVTQLDSMLSLLERVELRGNKRVLLQSDDQARPYRHRLQGFRVRREYDLLGLGLGPPVRDCPVSRLPVRSTRFGGVHMLVALNDIDRGAVDEESGVRRCLGCFDQVPSASHIGIFPSVFIDGFIHRSWCRGVEDNLGLDLRHNFVDECRIGDVACNICGSIKDVGRRVARDDRYRSGGLIFEQGLDNVVADEAVAARDQDGT